MLNQCDKEITMRSKRKELKKKKNINKRGRKAYCLHDGLSMPCNCPPTV